MNTLALAKLGKVVAADIATGEMGKAPSRSPTRTWWPPPC